MMTPEETINAAIARRKLRNARKAGKTAATWLTLGGTRFTQTVKRRRIAITYTDTKAAREPTT